MPEDYETTTKSLLTSLKNLAKDYCNGNKGTSLSAVRTLKRGLISSQTVFPALVFVPVRERTIKIFSGGKYKVARDINVVLYSKLARPRDAMEQVMELAESWKEIFRDTDNEDNFQLKDNTRPTTYSYDFGQAEFGEIGDFDKAVVLQQAIIPMVFKSDEYFPTETIETVLSEESPKDFGARVYDAVKSYAELSYVKFAYKHTTPPIPVARGVAVTVMPDTERQEFIYTGQNNVTRMTDIYVWSKASPFEDMLDVNLDTVEKVKDVLQTNLQWDGYAWNSRINIIDYGVNEALLLYGSRLEFMAESRETIPAT